MHDQSSRFLSLGVKSAPWSHKVEQEISDRSQSMRCYTDHVNDCSEGVLTLCISWDKTEKQKQQVLHVSWTWKVLYIPTFSFLNHGQIVENLVPQWHKEKEETCWNKTLAIDVGLLIQIYISSPWKSAVFILFIFSSRTKMSIHK